MVTSSITANFYTDDPKAANALVFTGTDLWMIRRPFPQLLPGLAERSAHHAPGVGGLPRLYLRLHPLPRLRQHPLAQDRRGEPHLRPQSGLASPGDAEELGC